MTNCSKCGQDIHKFNLACVTNMHKQEMKCKICDEYCKRGFQADHLFQKHPNIHERITRDIWRYTDILLGQCFYFDEE